MFIWVIAINIYAFTSSQFINMKRYYGKYTAFKVIMIFFGKESRYVLFNNTFQ